MASISSIGSGANSIDTLIDQFIAPERKPVNDLEDTKKELRRRLTVYIDLKSKLKELQNITKEFARVGSLSSLLKKTATTSNENYLTVSATTDASVGNHTVKIDRIASADTGVSKQLTRDGNNLATSSSGLQEFTIAIGGGDAVTVSVTIDVADTNEEAMNKVRDAINAADLDVNASIIYDTSDTARLIIKSSKTGSENEINLAELSGSNILRKLKYLNVDGERRQTDGTKGGFLMQDTANLDSKFSFDGVEVIKGTNEVGDILTGATIKLLRVQDVDDAPLTFTIANDTENTKQEIEKFIEKYNETIKYLNAKTSVDPVNFTRGDFTGDVVFRGLKFSMRSLVTNSIAGLPQGDVQFLAQVGIEIARDGTLSIGDSKKFEDSLNNNLEQVTNLFASENGLGNLFDDLLDKFVSTGGAVDRGKKGISRRISSIDTRIKNYEARLLIREQSLRRKFTELQKSLSLLNSQQSIIQNYLANTFQTGGSLGFGFF